jgi:hypothetical protein
MQRVLHCWHLSNHWSRFANARQYHCIHRDRSKRCSKQQGHLVCLECCCDTDQQFCYRSSWDLSCLGSRSYRCIHLLTRRLDVRGRGNLGLTRRNASVLLSHTAYTAHTAHTAYTARTQLMQKDNFCIQICIQNILYSIQLILCIT